MKDAIHRGEIVQILESLLTHPTHADGLARSGDLVFVGLLYGVAVDSAAAATDTIRVCLCGVVKLICAASNGTANAAIAIGDKLYYADADAFAAGTLTSDATAPADAASVVIGGVTYTFKTTLSTAPAVPYEVLIGGSAAVALDNLKSAINKTAGEGTAYATGTLIHPSVNATTNTNTTQVVVANVAGGLGDSIATPTPSASPASHMTWGATTLVAGSAIGEPNKDTGKVGIGIALGVVAVGAGSGLISVKLRRTF